ncbi:MAG TPA: SRPBCC domain-containing protein [Steroidobacteraceae bacterium]|jgi:uncharacterized protein YndB with AHSA1/START domain
MTTTALRSIVVEKILLHPPEKIWRALTDPALIERWLMRNDFAPVVGHRFNFRAKPVMGWNGVTDCEVLEVTPPSRLVYRWNASGEQAAMGLKTTVTWTLVPVEGGTRVRMEHADFRPEDENGYRGMGGGWPGIVDRLGVLAGELA